MAGLIISSGITSSGFVIVSKLGGSSYNSMTILDGGTASDTMVSAAGRLFVSSGGMASSTTVNGGYMLVSSGGTADDLVIGPSGNLSVFAGGSAIKVTENGGFVLIENGAEVTFAPNTISGLLLGSAHQRRSATVHSGTTATDVTIESGSLSIFEKGIVCNTIVGYNGSIILSSGGKLTGHHIFNNSSAVSATSNSIFDFDLTHLAPEATALVNDLSAVQGTPTYTLTVDSNVVQGFYFLAEGVSQFNQSVIVVNTDGTDLGILSLDTTVLIDGIDYALSLYDTTLCLSVGGAPRPKQFEGVELLNVSKTVHEGETYNNTTILSAGELVVSSGGVVNNTVVNSWGDLSVLGGVANDTTVNSAGGILIASGGIANNIVVQSRGGVEVYDGGTANNITLDEYSWLYIYDGAVDNVSVNKGTLSIEFGGGTATNIDWTPCEGRVEYRYDAYVTFVSKYSGVYYGASNQLLSHVQLFESKSLGSSDIMYVMSGGTASYISGSGSGWYEISIWDGGVMNDAVINSGMVSILSGGTVNNIDIPMGELWISSGGVANNVSVNASTWLLVESGGTATNVFWTPCVGTIEAYDGGVSFAPGQHSGVYYGSNNQLLSNTMEMTAKTIGTSASMCVMQDGIAKQTKVSGSGSLCIYDGGIAEETTVSASGDIFVMSGGTMTKTSVLTSGWAAVSNGGVADFTTIGYGGKLNIYKNGLATDVVISSGGSISVQSGGTVTNINAASGAYLGFTIAPGTYASGTSNGSAFEVKDALISGMSLTNGYVGVVSGGRAESVILINSGWMHLGSGGVANHITLNSKGTFYVSNGGVANSTIVNASGNLNVGFNGIASSAIVYSGGSMDVYFSGIASDSIISGGYVLVRGDGILHVASMNGGRLNVSSGGTANLSKTIFENNASVTVSSAATMNMMMTAGSGTVTIEDGASFIIRGNDLSQMKFKFLGSGAIDLSGNYWGTTDIDAIYAKLGVDYSKVVIDDVLLTDPTTTFSIVSNSLNHNYIGKGTDSITFTLAHDIDISSVSPEKITMTSTQGDAVAINEVTVEGKQISVKFNPLTVAGNYRLAFADTITDIAGAPLVSLRETGLADGVGELLNLRADFTSPYVVKVSPDGDFAGTLTTFTVHFSGAVDPLTIAGNVQLITPNGSGITPTTYKAISNSSIEFTVPGQTAYGTYQIRVLNNVADYAGNKLDQNQNGIGGEANDSFISEFVIADVDLKIQNLELSKTTLSLGETVTINWEVINSSGYALYGNWTDGVYLSKDARWDVNDILLGSVTHPDGLGENQTLDSSLTVNLSGVKEGDYYLLVRSDIYMQEQTNREAADAAQNLEAAAITVAIPQMTQDVAMTGAIHKNGDFAYYKVHQDANQSLKLVLDSLVGSANMELYVGFDSAPTTEIYDKKVMGIVDGSIFLDAQLSERDVYIMVRAKKTSSEFDYTLTAQSIPMSITKVTGTEQGNRTTTYLDVSGVDFAADSTVFLKGATGNTVAPTTLHFIDSTRMKLEFEAGTLAPGDYALTVVSGSETATAEETITIVNQYGAKFDLTFDAPSVVGRHATATMSIKYANSGYDAMEAVLVVMAPKQYHTNKEPTEGAYLTLDSKILNQGFWTSNMPEGFSYSVSFLATGESAGLIMPGESFTVPVYYTGWRTDDWDFGNSHIDWNVYYVTADNTSALDWNEQLAGMGYSEEYKGFLVNALTQSVGSTWGDYVSMLSRNLKYLDDLGASSAIETKGTCAINTNDLLDLEIKRITGQLTPYQTLESATDFTLTASSLNLEVIREYRSDAFSRYEKSSFGYGWTCNWDISLEFDADGNIVFHNGEAKTVFQPNYYNSFTNASGDGSEVKKIGDNYKITDPDGSAYMFNSAGQLQNITDRYGSVISCTYTDGMLTKLTHSNGNYLALFRNEDGTIVGITDSNGKTVKYTYDSNGNLVAAGNTQYAYSETWAHALTSAGKTTYSWNENGLLSGFTSGGITTALSYGENGEVHETATDGTDLVYSYGVSNTFLKLDNSVSGITVQYQYDSDGRIVGITDSNSHIIAITYDKSGHLASYSDDGKVTSFEYNQEGCVSKIIEPSGISTEYDYNADGQLIAAYHSNNTTEEWSYDRKGQLTSYTNIKGVTTNYSYDSNGNPTGISIDYIVSGFSYDSNGNCIGVTNGLGNSHGFLHNEDGLLTQFTDTSGNTTKYSYNADNKLSLITYADGSTESYSYTEDGVLSSWRNRNGETIHYSFDATGKIEQTIMSDGTSLSCQYDATGNLVVAGDISFTYDEKFNLIRQSYADGRRIEYTYDPNGFISSVTDELGHATIYSYTPDGRFDRLTNESGTLIVDYDYNTDGSVSKIVYGNSSYTLYAYNDFGEVMSIDNYNAENVLDTFTHYTYNSLGLRDSMTTQDGVWAYQYDKSNQIVEAVFTDKSGEVTQNFSYEYDAMGNRTKYTENGTVTTYTYNNLNQIVTATINDVTTVYRYDLNGNLLEDDKRTYTWTADNRVASETLKYTGQTWTYGYDALGNRVSSTTNGITTTYSVDVYGNVLGEYTDGVWNRCYQQAGLLVGWIDNNEQYYFNNDALGSVIAVSGAEGTVNVYSYDPYGNILSSTEDVTNSFEYVGGCGLMKNDSGTIFVRARNYDPETGRWISEDPFGILGGTNLYSFCWNNSINYVDESGFLAVKKEEIIQAVDNDALDYIILNGNIASLVSYLTPIGNADKAKVAQWGWNYNASAVSTQTGQLLRGLGYIGAAAEVTKNALQYGNSVDFYVYSAPTLISMKFPQVGAGIFLIDTLYKGAVLSGDLGATVMNKLGLGESAYSRGLMYLGDKVFDAGNYLKENVVYGITDWIYRKINGDPLRWAKLVRPPVGNGTAAGGNSQMSYSSDPNDKLGPVGYGEKAFVSAQQKMDYTVRFENEEDATAPARWVRVFDTLDESLDLDTFEIKEFCLAGNLVTVGDGRSSYNQRVTINVMGKDVLMDVEINLDKETRQITASFMAIDPETGYMLMDVTNGLLFPNDASGRGDGHIRYSLDLLEGIETGTEVTNKAEIYFDFNDPIDTPVVSNMVDATDPLTPSLELNTDGETITLTFAGDDLDSGVAGYNIMYSTDGDSYIAYGFSTYSELILPGASGTTYYFKVQIVDNVGNVSGWSEVKSVHIPGAGPDNLNGTPTGLSWDAVEGASGYVVEYSLDDFEHFVRFMTESNSLDSFCLPVGSYQWRVRVVDDDEWVAGESITVDADAIAPQLVQSNEDGNNDLFFASPNGTWGNIYYAQHVGSLNDWSGTNELISANGKGRIQNLYFGSSDPNVLCLTDGENGDAIFVDDVYTELPETVAEHTARLYKIQEVRAGAGDDIVDMTSKRFEYIGDGLTISGGEGNDTIWANKGNNSLFGDAGNDRIVGASGNDVIVGGIGDDSMHGGGGDDMFAFCGNWGADTVQQLESGTVTLWFASGDESKWNAETLTYTDGDNSVTVKGVTSVTLKFGNDGSEQYATLASAGAFEAFTSRRIFEEADKGILASM